MRGERDHQDFLDDILETIGKVERNTKCAVKGEAVKNIPENVRDLNPDVPWSEMVGMRDKLIHAYFGVDLSVVWMAVASDLPELKKAIANIS